MKNVLFISSHLPSDKVPEAGQKIALARLRSFQEQGCSIYLVAFYNKTEAPYADLRDFGFCAETILVPVSNWKRVLSVLFHPLLPVRIASRISSRARGYICSLSKRVRLDLVHFEYTSSAYYESCFPEKLDKTIVEHDVTYQSFERRSDHASGVKKILLVWEMQRQKKWELVALKKMNSVIVLNTKDARKLVSDGIPEKKIEVVVPEVDRKFLGIDRRNIEPYTILFWGAMNREENCDGVLWFVREIFPEILRVYPGSRLLVVGSNPPEKILRLRSDNIVVTGFVDDPLPYFRKTHLAAAPLRLGAGIKMKVLECLAAGIRVVATTVGGEGIENPGLVIADDPASFASAVTRIFDGWVKEREK